MSNQLQNICVFIKDEAQLEEAREMLERFGHKICSTTFYLDDSWDYLQLYSDNTWGMNITNLKQITITELEKMLKDELRAKS